MNKKLVLLIAIFIITLAAGAVIVYLPSNKVIAPTTVGEGVPTTTPDTTPATTTNLLADLIRPALPASGSQVSSPVTISGEARGTWYFEASFPVEIQDAAGNVIAQGPAKAQGEWMTEDFVPFTITLTYPPQPAGSKGIIVLKKDNPSGDPARDQQTSVSITFK